MCNHVIRLTDAGQVDDEMVNWVHQAYRAVDELLKGINLQLINYPATFNTND
jgi:hypothetical protein